MTKRGKVLRDTNAGPGLIAVDGQHYQFSLEGIWRGEVPPSPGMSVSVEFSAEGSIAAISPVPESQIAKEHAEAVAKAAGEQGKKIAAAAVERFGMPMLVATGLLLVGWFFLSAVSIQSPLGKIDFTFWQVLGFINSGNAFESAMEGRNSAGAGFYGLLAIVAIIGPYLNYFWKDKRASLAGLLPFVFMLFAGIMFRSSIASSMGGDISGPLGDIARQAREEALKAVSLGFGGYVSSLVGLYFAAVGVKRFLLSRGLNTEVPERSSQAAA